MIAIKILKPVIFWFTSPKLYAGIDNQKLIHLH